MNTINETRYDKKRRVSLVGKETLLINRNFTRLSGNSGYISNRPMLSQSHFIPRVELQLLLKRDVNYSRADLEDANRALNRIDAEAGIDFENWAIRLSQDLSKFDD